MNLVDRKVVAVQQQEVAIMAMNKIQFPPGLSMPEILKDYASLSGCYHALGSQKYATRYLAALSYRFNRRLELRTLHQYEVGRKKQSPTIRKI